ncbi:MAG: permease-like cell division protein FtsX [Proteobacteria bacterium]|nr:permease-like cell division protein FtsX [Pseudomonadota bacterium]
MNIRRTTPAEGARRFRTESVFLQHWRALGESFKQVDANRAPTAIGIAVMAVAIALPALLYIFIQNQHALFEDWGDEASLSAFLHRGVEAGAAARLMQQLAGDSRVASVRLIHRDDAFAEFAASSGLADIADDEVNPLPHVVVLVPRAATWDADRAQSLIASLESNTSIDTVLVDFAWIDRLSAIGRVAERAVFIVALLLAGGALLIVGNTIRALVHQHQDEIEVLKLVGATDAFIRRPFLYSGAMHGFLAGAAAALLVETVFAALKNPVARVAETYLSDFTIAGFSAVQAVLLIAVSCGLGWSGAWIGIILSLRPLDPVD